MYAQNGEATSTRSVIYNYFVGGGWPFQLRDPGAWAFVRAVAVMWFITLGTVLWTHGFSWGALLYLAATKDLALGFRLLKTRLARQQ